MGHQLFQKDAYMSLDDHSVAAVSALASTKRILVEGKNKNRGSLRLLLPCKPTPKRVLKGKPMGQPIGLRHHPKGGPDQNMGPSFSTVPFLDDFKWTIGNHPLFLGAPLRQIQSYTKIKQETLVDVWQMSCGNSCRFL